MTEQSSQESVTEESTEQEATAPQVPSGIDLRSVIEALLFVSKQPLSLDKLAGIIDEFTRDQIKDALERLSKEYDEAGAAIRIEAVAGGYHMLTRKEYAPWLLRLYKQKRSEKLTPASLETLAIIAYKQPITRANMEAIRGVNCDYSIRQLLERDLIRVAGHAKELGRPIQYGTTKKFLEHFGLDNIKDLPAIEDITKK